MPARSKNVDVSVKGIKTRLKSSKKELSSGAMFLKRLKDRNKRQAAALRRMDPILNTVFKIRKNLRSKKIDVTKILEDLLEMVEIHGKTVDELSKKIQVQEDRLTRTIDELKDLKNGAFEQLKWYVRETQKTTVFDTINTVRFPGDSAIGGLLLEDTPIFSEE
jgi:uncharacterized protein YaaN involved in tellurite resistance